MIKKGASWMMAAGVLAGSVAFGDGVKAVDNTPGFVKVEWSEKDGETWEVKGLADRESGRPMAKDSVFAICSNTKPVTSVLALTFVEEGKIDLDDPVSKYYPEFSDIRFNDKCKAPKKAGDRPEHPILLRHLITHLSGLCYSVRTDTQKPDAVSLEDQVRFAVRKGVSREPGERYAYNGLGFAVMGAVLEKISGRKVADLMKERIFDPLGMTETTFYPSAELMGRAAVVYHYPKDGGTPVRIGFGRFSEPLDNPARTPLLAGGLFATAGDYLKFAQMLALKGVGLNGRRILKEETFEQYLATRQTPPGDKVDASFDIHFNPRHTGGQKGGLYGTGASWDWASRSCKVSFKAISAKKPKEMSFNAGETGSLSAETPNRGVPSGCDASVMSAAYWRIWNADEQAKIDADIERNRKSDFVVELGRGRSPSGPQTCEDDVPEGTVVTVDQLAHEFRFGAHIFNFNQLGKSEYNDAYKVSYGAGGLFNQATVAFYWSTYEPTPGYFRANGAYEDGETYWNGLSQEEAMHDPFWRRPAPGPVVDFLKKKDVAVHGHILIWGLAKPAWIYDWYCPEEEKRAFDRLGIPRHAAYMPDLRKGAAADAAYANAWKRAWREAYRRADEAALAKMAPRFTAEMRRLFRKRVCDVAEAFGDMADSWDVVNESSRDWTRYRQARTGLPVWRSTYYGLMPGDYPLQALLDAKETLSPAAKLAINDFNVGDDFLEQVRQLEAEGARIDIVGCQMHIFNTNDCRRLAQGETGVKWISTPDDIQARLDTMAKTGKRLHVSEVTIAAPGTDEKSRQIQAILVRNIYRKWFSHKALMGVTWWNTVDGGGLYSEPRVSGLFTRDMRKKPAYRALDELINGEWRTKVKVKVEGEQRMVSFRGFRGKYRLSWMCKACGKEHSREVWLTGSGADEGRVSACVAPCRGASCERAARIYSVNGRCVELPADERVLDVRRLCPVAVSDSVGTGTWTDVACTVVAPKDGDYDILRVNNCNGRLVVNGVDVGDVSAVWDFEDPYFCRVSLRAGVNRIVVRMRGREAADGRFGVWLPQDSPLTFE